VFDALVAPSLQAARLTIKPAAIAPAAHCRTVIAPAPRLVPPECRETYD
jgi:hypothetical protein